MLNLILPAVMPIIDKLVDLIPNSNERARAREEFERELSKAVNEAAMQQAKINEVEASHSSVFVAGWRPFIGWTCGVGIAYVYLVYPFLIWYMTSHGIPATDLPKIDTDSLFQLVLAMLGLGTLRTFEKYKGVTK